MQAYYAMADVALLGGSFAPLGGQNLIEALACGCPVVMGPHTFNFADAARQAVECGAAWQEADLPQALRRVQWLLGTEQGRVALVQARRTGLELVAAGRGAARKQAQAIVDAAAVAAVRTLSVPPAS
jgi:3-deoxy-D-manno-octulosonic-acid transferase